ncbi:hypothetical protein AB0J90_11900 [Micromonospora sp. NPDC049523]|uniref:hypothetical protein n=1 Tax=Micromonospora sp. NPDC049523 TaxID=3155921 RepID=UPI00343B2E19
MGVSPAQPSGDAVGSALPVGAGTWVDVGSWLAVTVGVGVGSGSWVVDGDGVGVSLGVGDGVTGAEVTGGVGVGLLGVGVGRPGVEVCVDRGVFDGAAYGRGWEAAPVLVTGPAAPVPPEPATDGVGMLVSAEAGLIGTMMSVGLADTGSYGVTARPAVAARPSPCVG